jgi:hypothetical protein
MGRVGSQPGVNFVGVLAQCGWWCWSHKGCARQGHGVAQLQHPARADVEDPVEAELGRVLDRCPDVVDPTAWHPGRVQPFLPSGCRTGGECKLQLGAQRLPVLDPGGVGGEPRHPP